MRQISPTMAAANETEIVYKISASLTVYKSRVYFENSEISPNLLTEARTKGDGLPPLGEAMAYYSSGEILTAYVNEDESVFFALSKAGVTVTPEIDTNWLYTNLGNRPGVWKDPESNACVLGYYDQDYRRWMLRDILYAPLMALNGECVSAEKFSVDLEQGAIYPVSLDEAIILDLYEGGMRFSFVDSAGGVHTCERRYMNPTKVLGEDYDDIYVTHYAGAVKRGSTIFVYFTDYTGAVKNIRYSLSPDGLNGYWSDFSTSIPQDLCISNVGNAFLKGDRIFLSVNFFRSEDFASDTIYNLLVWSDDGLTFTMNRRVLYSLSGLRFLAAVDGNKIVFSSSARYYETDSPYQVIGEAAPKTVTVDTSISGSPSSEMQINLTAGDERYFSDDKIAIGAYAKLELSEETSIGRESVKYTDGVIASITKSVKDGFRGHSVTLAPDGFWHTASMSHPFYMEFQGKQSIFDPLTDFSNMVKSSIGENAFWALSVDFWEGDGTSPGYETHPGGTSTDHWSADLLQSHSAYPKLGEDSYYTARIYGWSRAGRPDTDPNTADDTPQNTLNDKFYLLLEVKNPDLTTSETKAYQLDPLEYLMSAYANPPQTYFATNPGSLPVIWAFPNPGAGWEILKIGVRVVSDTGNTTYNLERVELPGISSQPISVADAGGTFSVAPLPLFGGTGVSSQWVPSQSNTGITFDSKIVWAPQVPACVLIGTDTILFSTDGASFAPVSYPAGTWLGGCWSAELGLFVVVGVDAVMTSPNGTDWTLRSCPQGRWRAVAWAPEISTFACLSQETNSVFNHNMTSSDGITWVAGAPDQTRDSSAICWADSLGVFIALTGLIDANGPLLPDGSGYGFGNASATSPDGVTWTSHSSQIDGTPTSVCWSSELKIAIAVGMWGRIMSSYDGINWTARGPTSFGQGWRSVTWSSVMKIFIVKRAYSMQYPTGCVTSPDGINWTSSWYVNGGAIYPLDEYNPDGQSVKTTIIYPGSNTTYSLQFYYPVVPASSYSKNAKSPSSIVCEKKNIPQILLSTRPYSSYNFEQTCRATIEGPYSVVGLVGLATDKQNFILASIGKDKARISKYRAGIETVLVEVAAPGLTNQKLDLRFWHRDGRFGFEYKLHSDVVWPERGSLLSHYWMSDNGEMALNDDIFHVGAYSFIDPPRFRITGFLSDKSVIGVLPIDLDLESNTSDFLLDFPASGKIDLGGIKYTYSGKSVYFPNNDMRGPFQLCNTRAWNSPYNAEFDGSYSYQGGKAIEFLMFDYSVGGGLAGWANGAVIASSSGHAWINDQTQWVPWIRTSGQKVLLRARVRMYADDMPDWYPSTSEKVYVTNGLTGVARVENADDTYQYSTGEYAFLDSDDKVTIFGYHATSGDSDQTIRSLIALLNSIAGTRADFPGDNIVNIAAPGWANGDRMEFSQ